MIGRLKSAAARAGAQSAARPMRTMSLFPEHSRGGDIMVTLGRAQHPVLHCQEAARPIPMARRAGADGCRCSGSFWCDSRRELAVGFPRTSGDGEERSPAAVALRQCVDACRLMCLIGAGSGAARDCGEIVRQTRILLHAGSEKVNP